MTDASLPALGELRHLQLLFTTITDKGVAGLATLSELVGLRRLNLAGSFVGADGVAAVQQALPRGSC